MRFVVSTTIMCLRVDRYEVFVALPSLYAAFYIIDKGEASMATRSCWHFNRCTPHPTSTKSKHPSSQTEKMCVGTEFGSYKALVVVRADINQF
eukprot:scaffold13174_cov50-Skeletonema_dohrnii-CCMP3373.AAC.1